MKVKGPIFIGGVVVGSSDIVVDLSVSTADLIAELEKRRPCERCHHPVDMGEACIFATCMWWQIGGEDKFKEAK